MAEAIGLAYRGTPSELQNRIKRVVDVWRGRQVFGKDIQDSVDNGIAGSLMAPTNYLGALEMPYVRRPLVDA